MGVSKMRSLSVYKKAKSYPTRPILTDEERMTPMLLCRVPSIPKQYSRERLNQLATPKKDHLDELSRPLNNVKWGNQEPQRKILLVQNWSRFHNIGSVVVEEVKLRQQ